MNRRMILLLGAAGLFAITALTVPAVTESTETVTPPEIETIPEETETTEPIIDTVTPSPLDEYSIEDIDLAAKVVQAESGNQDFTGKRLVAAVILNRIDSGDFPDTVEDVVYQKNQFSTVTDGALEKAEQTVTGEDYAAVEMEILDRTDTKIMYFTAGNYNPSGTPAYKHGGHYFCYE